MSLTDMSGEPLKERQNWEFSAERFISYSYPWCNYLHSSHYHDLSGPGGPLNPRQHLLLSPEMVGRLPQLCSIPLYLVVHDGKSNDSCCCGRSRAPLQAGIIRAS